MKIDNQLMKDMQQHGVFVANKPGTDKLFNFLCVLVIDIFVIKRRGGYCACANWKSRTNISCRLIASIAQSRYLKAFYKLGLLLIIWIKAV